MIPIMLYSISYQILVILLFAYKFRDVGLQNKKSALDNVLLSSLVETNLNRLVVFVDTIVSTFGVVSPLTYLCLNQKAIDIRSS